MATDASLVTAEQLEQMPDDGFRYELIRGELRKMTPAGFDHGVIAGRIARSLSRIISDPSSGEICIAETGFLIDRDPDTVRAPDVAFIRPERVLKIGRVRGFFPGAPDLAVEVVSPSDLYSEVVEKALQWLDAGCRSVIVVDPRKKSATVYRSHSDIAILTGADSLDGGDVIPGWSLSLAELFA